MASFDIVCEVDIQEVTNAVDQARREINNRYDFKGTNCEIELDKIKPALMITADDELKMQTTIDILLTKLIKRSVPVKSLVYGKTEPSGRVQKKEILIQQGLSKDQCNGKSSRKKPLLRRGGRQDVDGRNPGHPNQPEAHRGGDRCRDKDGMHRLPVLLYHACRRHQGTGKNRGNAGI